MFSRLRRWKARPVEPDAEEPPILDAFRTLFDRPDTTDPAPLAAGSEDDPIETAPAAPVLAESAPDAPIPSAPIPTAPTLDAPTAPLVTVRPLGALANRMIQHMLAMSIVARVPGARISRVNLPEWGIEQDVVPDAPAPTLELKSNRVDVAAVAAALRDGTHRNVLVSGYAQNVANFLRTEDYRPIFRTGLAVEGFGDDVLLINLRMNEILTADYPPYVLLPVAFYRQVVRDTGLRPVFFGQITPCPYLDDLKAAFPAAEFIPGAGAIHDFEVIRRSRNVCVAISTFSWVAAWLSDAARIVMPLSGLFNPVWGRIAASGLDLVPRDDARYLFYLFPLNDAVTQDRVPDVHRSLEGRWRLVTSPWIDDCLARHQRIERSRDDHLAIFDEAFYLTAYGDLARAKERGALGSGRDHYEAHGFEERRIPCALGRFYGVHYPQAALAVAEGRYHDLIHYYASRGRFIGEHPMPDD